MHVHLDDASQFLKADALERIGIGIRARRPGGDGGELSGSIPVQRALTRHGLRHLAEHRQTEERIVGGLHGSSLGLPVDE